MNWPRLALAITAVEIDANSPTRFKLLRGLPRTGGERRCGGSSFPCAVLALGAILGAELAYTNPDSTETRCADRGVREKRPAIFAPPVPPLRPDSLGSCPSIPTAAPGAARSPQGTGFRSQWPWPVRLGQVAAVHHRSSQDQLLIEVVVKDPKTGTTDRLPNQPISGAFHVRADGTVGLGAWGCVSVAGFDAGTASRSKSSRTGGESSPRRIGRGETHCVGERSRVQQQAILRHLCCQWIKLRGSGDVVPQHRERNGHGRDHQNRRSVGGGEKVAPRSAEACQWWSGSSSSRRLGRALAQRGLHNELPDYARRPSVRNRHRRSGVAGFHRADHNGSGQQEATCTSSPHGLFGNAQ